MPATTLGQHKQDAGFAYRQSSPVFLVLHGYGLALQDCLRPTTDRLGEVG
jgi:hypothetical protein